MKKTKAFEIFAACVNAIAQGVLIDRVSKTDKEFHFQNWFEDRLPATDAARNCGTLRAGGISGSIRWMFPS
jgi:hypothetical protein